MIREEVLDWWKQAHADLKAARDSAAQEHYEWACFQSQQAAEKALKALYIHRKRTTIATHNIVRTAQELRAPRVVGDAAKLLNADYVMARYPDAANGVPAEQYTEAMAREHVGAAETVLRWVSGFLKP